MKKSACFSYIMFLFFKLPLKYEFIKYSTEKSQQAHTILSNFTEKTELFIIECQQDIANDEGNLN